MQVSEESEITAVLGTSGKLFGLRRDTGERLIPVSETIYDRNEELVHGKQHRLYR